MTAAPASAKKPLIALTPGSHVRVRSAGPDETAIDSVGVFRGLVSIGGDNTLAIELDGGAGEEKGRVRLVPVPAGTCDRYPRGREAGRGEARRPVGLGGVLPLAVDRHGLAGSFVAERAPRFRTQVVGFEGRQDSPDYPTSPRPVYGGAAIWAFRAPPRALVGSSGCRGSGWAGTWGTSTNPIDSYRASASTIDGRVSNHIVT